MTDDDIDFRGDRMDSPDGYGYARRAWEQYRKTSTRLLGPAVAPVAKKWAASQVVDVVGFWVLWNLEGGYEGLRRLGMSRTAIYRRIKLFRVAFGMHPDEWVVPGIKFDIEAYRTGKPYRREG